MKLAGQTLHAAVLPARIRGMLGPLKTYGPWKLSPEQVQALRGVLHLSTQPGPTVEPFSLPGLMKHQNQAIEFLTERDGRAMLAMDMGTGKTRTTIEFLRMRQVLSRTLVLAPKSVAIGTWPQEFAKWAPEVTPRLAVEGRKWAELTGEGPWITNYETARERDLLEQLARLRPQAIVLDESTKIKDPQTQTSKAVHGLCSLCTGPILALSGRPVTESPLDVFSQVKAFDPKPLGFKTWYAMRARYCVLDFWGNPTSYRDLTDFTGRLREVAFIVKKEDCLDLPPKIRERRVFELTGKEAKAYKQMKKDCLAVLGKQELSAANVLAQLIRLQQITSGWGMGDKASKIRELAEVLDEAPRPVVVWARFQDDIDRVAALGEKRKLRVATLDGRTSSADRARALSTFADRGLDLLAANPAAGGMGIQLQAASVQVYYSNPWSYEQRAQSEDRLHRVGQTKPVTIIDLVAQGTVDEVVLDALETKAKLSNEVLVSFVQRVFG